MWMENKKMSIKIYPYRQGSKSAKALAVALEGKVLKHVGSKYRPKRGDLVVNWGSGDFNPAGFAPATTLNADVTVAQCKLKSFQAFHGGDRGDKVSMPPWATTKDGARALQFPVVCRTKLRGHSGDGIVIANNADELVDAPLYTQYVKKKDEYRIHVCHRPDPDPDAHQYWPFFIQRKARKVDVENPNWQVRNLAGGFVFVEEEYNNVPFDVILQAINAIPALGLDFGGVDVMWNEKEGKAYVLEVNTACGLEDRTAQKYAEVFQNYLDNI